MESWQTGSESVQQRKAHTLPPNSNQTALRTSGTRTSIQYTQETTPRRKCTFSSLYTGRLGGMAQRKKQKGGPQKSHCGQENTLGSKPKHQIDTWGPHTEPRPFKAQHLHLVGTSSIAADGNTIFSTEPPGSGSYHQPLFQGS